MLSPSLSRLLAAAREEDLRRAAEAHRRGSGVTRRSHSLRASWNALRVRFGPDLDAHPRHGRARTPSPVLESAALTIRFAFPDDALALARLATLDSRDEIPSGPLLVAECEGELRAALSLRDHSVIADPFHPTAALLELLRARSHQLRSAAAARNAGSVERAAALRQSEELQTGWGSSW